MEVVVSCRIFFVPQDTTGMTSYYRMAATRGLIVRYTLDYTDKNRNKLKEYDTPQKMELI